MRGLVPVCESGMTRPKVGAAVSASLLGAMSPWRKTTMTNLYTLKPDIASEIAVQKESIVSKTVYVDDRVKVVLMALDSGQELSDHAASMPAVIHLLQGKARVVLGEDSHDLQQGAWAHMTPGLRHSVAAQSPTVLLLLLLKQAGA